VSEINEIHNKFTGLCTAFTFFERWFLVQRKRRKNHRTEYRRVWIDRKGCLCSLFRLLSLNSLRVSSGIHIIIYSLYYIYFVSSSSCVNHKQGHRYRRFFTNQYYCRYKTHIDISIPKKKKIKKNCNQTGKCSKNPLLALLIYGEFCWQHSCAVERIRLPSPTLSSPPRWQSCGVYMATVFGPTCPPPFHLSLKWYVAASKVYILVHITYTTIL
jgi:hypothetical protein